MLPGVDAITDDGGLAQRLGGFKPVQALDQYEARAILAHEDRRLLANNEHAMCDRIDALQVERFAPRCRKVSLFNMSRRVAQLRALCSRLLDNRQSDDELVAVVS
jgi:hypothetical protein